MNKIFLLKIIEGNDVGTVFEITDGTFDIMRTPHGGIATSIDRKRAIFLRDSEISKKHAKINLISGEMVIEDLGSTNGILVNNRKVTKSILLNNDKLKIGSTVFIVSVSEKGVGADKTFVGNSQQYSKPTHEFKKLAKIVDNDIKFVPQLNFDPPYPAGSKSYEVFSDLANLLMNIEEDKGIDNKAGLIKSYYFEIDVLDGKNRGEKTRFFRKKITIGRIGDFILDDDSISREHATIEVIENGLFKIKDLGSQNGTFINDTRVQIATFAPSDTLRIGVITLKFSFIDE